MIRAGEWNKLTVLREVEFGVYLDDGAEGILLPNRFLPTGIKTGDELEVFVYHDSEDRLIATTQKPKAVVGDITKLTCVSVTNHGAFLDWGLMKDVFVPKSQQLSNMRPKGEYIVKLYLDQQTGRVAATEKFQHTLNNDVLTVQPKDKVDMVLLRRTDLGYVVAINGVHTGLLHHSDIFKTIAVGDRMEGYIRKIYDNGNIDVVTARQGYEKTSAEAQKILQMLSNSDGYLPYHDKSDPEEIYLTFGISKKTFKMAIGELYRNKKIFLTNAGIKLADN